MNQKSELSAAALNASLGGGSAAAQAYKAQLAAEAAANSAASAFETKVVQAASGSTAAGAEVDVPQPAPMPTGADARTAERKKVTGRARIVLQGGGASLSGKMVDISVNGACVLLDDMVPVKKVCTFECDIFQNGIRRVFSAPAVSVYGVLASGHGFKVGFQFGPRSSAALKTIADIMR